MSDRRGFQVLDDSRIYPAEAKPTSPPPTYRPPSGGMNSPPPVYGALPPAGTKIPLPPSYEAPPLEHKTRPLTPVRTNTWERTSSELSFNNDMYDQSSSRTRLTGIGEPKYTRSIRGSGSVTKRNRKPWIIAGVAAFVVVVVIASVVGVMLAKQKAKNDAEEESTTEVVVEFEVEIHMEDLTWNNNLKNSSSDEYTDLANNVSMTMDESMSNTDGYEGIEVNSFSNGSVICDFTIKSSGKAAEETSEEEMKTKVTKGIETSGRLGKATTKVKGKKEIVREKLKTISLVMHLTTEDYDDTYKDSKSEEFKRKAKSLQTMLDNHFKSSSLKSSFSSTSVTKFRNLGDQGMDITVELKFKITKTPSTSNIIKAFSSKNKYLTGEMCVSKGGKYEKISDCTEVTTTKATKATPTKVAKKSDDTDFVVYIQFSEKKWEEDKDGTKADNILKRINANFKSKGLSADDKACKFEHLSDCMGKVFVLLHCQSNGKGWSEKDVYDACKEDPKTDYGTMGQAQCYVKGATSQQTSGQPWASSQQPSVQAWTSSQQPSVNPGASSQQPSVMPGASSQQPSVQPGVSSQQPSVQPGASSQQPSVQPGVSSQQPSVQPGASSQQPSVQPGASSQQPSVQPGASSQQPSVQPGASSQQPSVQPGASSQQPSVQPGTSSQQPSVQPGSSSLPISGASVSPTSGYFGTTIFVDASCSSGGAGAGICSGNFPLTCVNKNTGQTGAYSQTPSGQTGAYSTLPSGQTGAHSQPPSGQTGVYSTPPSGQTGAHSQPPSGQTGAYSTLPSGQTGAYSKPPSGQTGAYSTLPSGQTGAHSQPPSGQTGAYSTPPSGQTGAHSQPPSGQTGAYSTLPSGQTGAYSKPPSGQTGAYSTLPSGQTGAYSSPASLQPGATTPPVGKNFFMFMQFSLKDWESSYEDKTGLKADNIMKRINDNFKSKGLTENSCEFEYLSNCTGKVFASLHCKSNGKDWSENDVYDACKETPKTDYGAMGHAQCYVKGYGGDDKQNMWMSTATKPPGSSSVTPSGQAGATSQPTSGQPFASSQIPSGASVSTTSGYSGTTMFVDASCSSGGAGAGICSANFPLTCLNDKKWGATSLSPSAQPGASSLQPSGQPSSGQPWATSQKPSGYTGAYSSPASKDGQHFYFFIQFSEKDWETAFEDKTGDKANNILKRINENLKSQGLSADDKSCTMKYTSECKGKVFAFLICISKDKEWSEKELYDACKEDPKTDYGSMGQAQCYVKGYGKSANMWMTTSPSFGQSGASSLPPSGQPGASSLPPSGQPGASSLPPSGQPAATSLPPSGQPGATSIPPSGQPGASSLPPSGQPAATSLPPSGQPGASSLPPSGQPAATSLPPSGQPGATSIPPSGQPGASSLPPSGQPGATSLPPSGQPGTSSLPPSGQPGATSLPSSGQPGATSLPSSGQPGATSLPPSGQPGASSLPPSGQPGATSIPPSGQPGASSLPPSGQPVATSVQPSGQPGASTQVVSGASVSPTSGYFGTTLFGDASCSSGGAGAGVCSANFPLTCFNDEMWGVTSLSPSGQPWTSSVPPSGQPVASSVPPSGQPVASSLPPSGQPSSGQPVASSLPPSEQPVTSAPPN